MFERYMVDVRRALMFARQEASQTASTAITADHFVLGFLRERNPGMLQILDRLQISESALRDAIRSQPDIEALQIPFDAGMRQVFDYAKQESERQRSEYIALEHMFVGILHEGRSRAARFLITKGVTPHDLLKDSGQ